MKFVERANRESTPPSIGLPLTILRLKGTKTTQGYPVEADIETLPPLKIGLWNYNQPRDSANDFSFLLMFSVCLRPCAEKSMSTCSGNGTGSDSTFSSSV